MTKVPSWVKNLVESKLSQPPLEVGVIARHKDGRIVKIIGGQFWGEFGISNFWYWRELKSHKAGCGYGHLLERMPQDG